MNILRLIGQNSLTGQDAPIRHKAKRRRIKTVLQELMFKAWHMIKHAGRWVLGLGENDTAFTVFKRLHISLPPRANLPRAQLPETLQKSMRCTRVQDPSSPNMAPHATTAPMVPKWHAFQPPICHTERSIRA